MFKPQKPTKNHELGPPASDERLRLQLPCLECPKYALVLWTEEWLAGRLF